LKFSRGLAALILTIFFQTTLSAEYLYKDEVIHNPEFAKEVETLGQELYQKTGISLRLVMIRELPQNENIIDYQNQLISKFSEPTILLTFAELNSKVDIVANDTSLYKFFDKEQVLSPVASPAQAFVMAIVYSNSIDTFISTAKNYGGTIIPLLASKSKKGEQLGKYSAAMFNGYADIAEQIANSKHVVLPDAVGNVNKNSILVIKTIFYGVIILSLFIYIKRRYFKRR
jgi:hypothetical protein